MRYPCRCNKRSCQARVTRNKHPDEYKIRKFAMCPRYPACDGKLYVDKFRMDKNNMEKDRGKTCYDDCLPYRHMTSNKKCKQYGDYVIERSLIASKHNPHRNLELVDFEDFIMDKEQDDSHQDIDYEGYTISNRGGYNWLILDFGVPVRDVDSVEQAKQLIDAGGL